MKILYIANARIPTEKAHGIQIMQMCSAFSRYNANTANSYANAANKVDVELVVPKRFNQIKQDPFAYYGIERSFKITRLPCLDLIIFDKYIGYLGLWVESFTFLISVFFSIVFKKADIFYTRNVLLLPLAVLKRNFFFEAHTFPKNYFLYSPFFKKLKGLAVITQKLKDAFLEQGIAENKILVVPDGVDIDKFDIKETKEECRQKLGLPQDKTIVLYTGHLYTWKGAKTLAEASQCLPKDVVLYFVGGTEKDVKKYKIQYTGYNIQIVGHRPYSEMPFWLRAADILVLPNSGKEEISKSWTSPLKLFEYMAAKKPIAASGLPSLREILNDENSILVEPDNPEALAQGIKKALDNPELANKISEQAFLDVQQYTWSSRAQKILNFTTC